MKREVGEDFLVFPNTDVGEHAMWTGGGGKVGGQYALGLSVGQ